VICETEWQVCGKLYCAAEAISIAISLLLGVAAAFAMMAEVPAGAGLAKIRMDRSLRTNQTHPPELS
jgi:DNA-binding phage protein